MSEEPHDRTGTPGQRALAAWLLQQETDDADGSDATLAAAEQSFQKLFDRLARLVTADGCQSLLARALHLARVEFPFLDPVQAGRLPGVCLLGLLKNTPGASPDQVEAGLVAVIAHVIGLLTLFIGDDLTVRLVGTVWPQAPVSGADSERQEADVS